MLPSARIIAPRWTAGRREYRHGPPKWINLHFKRLDDLTKQTLTKQWRVVEALADHIERLPPGGSISPERLAAIIKAAQR